MFFVVNLNDLKSHAIYEDGNTEESCGMRVADFYCGSGGFSEGFRQAGFEIVFAVDKWDPAVKTFKANKPGCTVIKDDVIRVSMLPDVDFHKLVPDTEVIIGSPPCVAFSNSNKSGNGDKTLGIALLKAYLRIVARKMYKENSILRYWVLENVPNIQKYVKEEYSAADLDMEGDYVLTAVNSSAGIYNSMHYGAPTNRKRFLCGSFPAPAVTANDGELITLRAIMESLGEPNNRSQGYIEDCNYRGLRLRRDDVSDHQYVYNLQPFEWETAKRLKEDRGYMGKMSFPENLDNPARTVMATMSSSSRESMILQLSKNNYRLPTVRETATMMSFPIDYRFYGKSKGIKHTLVGNAVPPKMSYAIACAIALDANEQVQTRYVPIQHDETISFYNLNNVKYDPKVERPKRSTSKFKYHIPYMILNAYRVELTNYHSDFDKRKFKWSVEMHYSQGKDKAKVYKPRKTDKHISHEMKLKISEFLDNIRPELLSFNGFQMVYCMTKAQRSKTSKVGPYELLEFVKQFLLDAIPRDKWGNPLKLSQKFPDVPEVLVVGYYLLNELIREMRGLRNE